MVWGKNSIGVHRKHGILLLLDLDLDLKTKVKSGQEMFSTLRCRHVVDIVH